MLAVKSIRQEALTRDKQMLKNKKDVANELILPIEKINSSQTIAEVSSSLVRPLVLPIPAVDTRARTSVSGDMGAARRAPGIANWIVDRPG